MEFNSSLYLSHYPSLLNAPIKANLSMLSLLRGISRALFLPHITKEAPMFTMYQLNLPF